MAIHIKANRFAGLRHATITLLLLVPAWGMAANLVHLTHNATTTDFGTIQAAVDAAVDGDSIAIDAGTFREQVTITKAITLQGAGVAQTIVESPDSTAVVQTGGNWKNLKNQDVFATIGVKLANGGSVTIRNLTVDGRDQGNLPDGTYPDKNSYDFQGIGIFDSNALIDGVKVTGSRYVSATAYAGYPDEPSGMNTNSGIFAESKAGAGNHTVEIRNSIVTKFQKTAILAWGPTLTVNIHDNTLQGYGQTLHSSGNGIQIASSDRTAQGGANGDRRGTQATITNNQILGFGHVVPAPGQTDSYLNLGQAGPSGIILYMAGNGVQITGNTITGPSFNNWYNYQTSNDGGFVNLGISVADSPNTVITGNTISGFDGGIVEGSAVSGSVATVSGNTFASNEIDVWTAGGLDAVTLTGGAETVAYNQTNNGTDTISGFGQGDRIRVVGYVAHSVNGNTGTIVGTTTIDTGSNVVITSYADGHPVVDFTGGTVTTGDGSSVPAKSVQVSASGGYTHLYVDTDGTTGPAELTIRLTGTYVPANFSLSGGYILYVPTYTVSGNAAPVQAGLVTCTATTVASGGSSTCSATANSGYVFSHWSGDCTGSTCNLTNITANKTVTANFNGMNVSIGVVGGNFQAEMLSPSCSGFESHAFEPATGKAPNGDPFVYGKLSFSTSCNSVTLRLSVPELTPNVHRLWKYTGGQWVDWTALATFDYTQKTVTYTIVDNGNGDNDPTAGRIADPIQLSGPNALTNVPTLSEWGLLILSGLMGLVAVVGIRRRPR